MTACETVIAPEAPGNQRYGYRGSAVVLHWDYSDVAESYTIYYGDSGCHLSADQPVSCEELATVWSTSYTHDVPGHDARNYWVVACNEGGCSEIDTANPANRLPSTPDGVRVAQEGSSLLLTWNPVQEATHYKVYHDDQRSFCASGDGRPFCKELDGNVVGTSYTDDRVLSAPYGLEVVDRTPDALTVDWRDGDDSHHYWVTACNDVGCSFVDEEVAASTELPIQYYRIYRSPRDGMTEEDEVIEYTPEPSSPDYSRYVDEGLRPNAVYSYRVAACNGNGCSNDGVPAGGAVTGSSAAGLTESDGPVDVPSAPALEGKKIEISGAPDNAAVTWDSMEGATYYEIWKGGSNPSRPFELAKEVSEPLESQSYATPVNRSFFGEYSVTSWRVRACNKAGCSPFSNVITIK